MADSAFKGAGKKVGLELWRIEKLEVKKISKVDGKFHSGDSYILLSTTQQTAGGAFIWNIHFWLGAESSQDESGIAAYKTVELDESLGGGPVQHREMQGFESALFMSYFKNGGGIQYLPGGVDSGFRKVEKDVYETRLLHLKGKRTVRVSEVPVKLQSLNKGDVFILDMGLTIFLFNGPDANKFEKAKGVQVAQSIKDDDRGGRAEIRLLQDKPDDADFWAAFGGFKDPQSLPDGPPDTEVDSIVQRNLFKISDESGSVKFTAVGSGQLEKSMLDSNDVFLLQGHHSSKLFLWIGKGANLTEKKEAVPHAMQYIKSNALLKSTAVERLSEGFETAAFKGEFATWDPPANFGYAAKSATSIASSGQSDVDMAALMSRKSAEDTPVDDGSGQLTVWVIHGLKKELVPASEHGSFFGGDSYILLYTYKSGSSEQHIIYFWLGSDSTNDEKGSAALLAVDLDDSMGGKPVQVRVTQGKEPAHFRQLFKGRMVVFKGGHASGFNGGSSSSSIEQDDTALFHIRGTNALNTVALQVAATATSLNSEDCFVLVTPSKVIAWMGNAANADEYKVAQSTAAALAGSYKGSGGRTVQELQESSSDGAADFWEALGGRQEYPQKAPGEAPPKEPRLFSASTATGSFRIEEIDNFDQSDLNDEDVFLLDTYTHLFVWVGSQSSEQEKKEALAFAQRYATEADDGRDPELPIVRILAGQEPSMFSCHFHGWDAEYFSKQIFKDPYEARLAALAEKKKTEAAAAPAFAATALKKTNSPMKPAAAADKPPPAAPAAAAAPTTPTAAAFKAPVAGAFKLEQLQEGVPDGVDPTIKEEYLDAATFKQLFDTDLASFKTMPKWKRDAAKKKHGLF